MPTSVEVGQQIVENERANDIYNRYISIQKRLGENVENLKDEQKRMLLGDVSLAKKAIEEYTIKIEEYYETLRSNK